MYIRPCPICGKKPVINECVSLDSKTRRRMCLCTNQCGVILDSSIPHSFFIFLGAGDNNEIFKIWNQYIERYNNVSKMDSGIWNKRFSPIDENREEQNSYFN